MNDTATAPAARTVDGVELPAAGTWSIDASHSSVNFKVNHLGLAKTRGRFTRFEGTVEMRGPGRHGRHRRDRRRLGQHSRSQA